MTQGFTKNSISITGDSGGAISGNSFSITGGTTGLSFAGSGTTETLGGTLVVANGGTGAATLTGILTGNGTSPITANAVTQHGVLIGGASNAVGSTAVGATGTVFAGNTGADPSFTATPTLTSVTFGAGTALSVYQQGTFTPALSFGGASVGITYSTQSGGYTRIGNLVFIQGVLVLTSKGSSTGTTLLTGLPFTVNASYNPIGIVGAGAGPVPDSGFQTPNLQFLAGTTTAAFSETALVNGNSQNMTNTNFGNTTSFYFSGLYQI